MAGGAGQAGLTLDPDHGKRPGHGRGGGCGAAISVPWRPEPGVALRGFYPSHLAGARRGFSRAVNCSRAGVTWFCASVGTAHHKEDSSVEA